jgi:hypothetical protein
MANAYDAALFVCPITGWTVVPIATRSPIVTSKGTYVQWYCCACDSSGRPRSDPAYRASEPGVHAVRVTPPAPALWQSKYAEVME